MRYFDDFPFVKCVICASRGPYLIIAAKRTPGFNRVVPGHLKLTIKYKSMSYSLLVISYSNNQGKYIFKISFTAKK